MPGADTFKSAVGGPDTLTVTESVALPPAIPVQVRVYVFVAGPVMFPVESLPLLAFFPLQPVGLLDAVHGVNVLVAVFVDVQESVALLPD